MQYFLLFVCLVLTGCTQTPYRLPYVNGTEVEVMQDHTTHSTPTAEMFDIRATSANQTLAAAKAGWVRFIKDSGNSSASTNNYVWIEHPLNYCQPPGSAAPGTEIAIPCKRCNKGLGRCNEWTLYAHMVEDSVTAAAGAGLSVGDWVTTGQPIGVEGDVGFTPCGASVTPLCGRHVHFAVWRFEVDSLLARPSQDGDYEDYVDMYGRPELVPRFCTSTGLRYPRQGDVYVVADCP